MKGHIRRRGKQSWAIVIDIGKGPDGRRRQKWHSVRGTRRDAERELVTLLHGLATDTYVEPSKLRLSEYLARWLRDYAKTNVAGKTFERSAEIIHDHLVPALGNLELRALQPLHIQEYYSAALAGGRLSGRGGLSKRTVLHHHRLLRAALQQALKWQLITRNPADAAVAPRPVRAEMRTLDERETAVLLRTAEPGRFYIPLLLALTTGMRRGEILALRWTNTDLDDGTASVQQSLQQTREGLEFKNPKTRSARRTIALPSLTVEALRKHRSNQASLSSRFRDLVRRAGLKHVRFHDLRHTHATHLLARGINAKVVSERLGHSTVSLTLDVYAHVLPSMQAKAAEEIDVMIRKAIETD